ncbi:MAG TPA: Ig-like domain repeat protein [Humisphaera sp.]|jgi:parallel beta-helix repeat protein|nr:Ig-like domain repeat protein [Humisphaera sp.]
MRGITNHRSIRANSSPLARLRAAQRRQAVPRMRQACSTAMERLEGRQLMSVAVSTTADSGTGSLRDALIYAQSHAGTTITFDLGSGTNVIAPTTSLPQVPDSTTIAASGHAVVIDGTHVGGDGLDLAGANSVIDGLVIVNFSTGAGIHILGTAHDSIVRNCYVGVDATGSAAAGNASGITIDSADDQIINNVISANTNEGISVNSGGSGAVIQSNKIGTDATGEIDLGNSFDGIDITGASGLTIGGALGSTGNLISGNSGSGIVLVDASYNTIAGNLIGPDLSGVALLNDGFGNGASGIDLKGVSGHNTVGGSDAASRNVISNNNTNGIRVRTSDSEPNSFVNNGIGVGSDGVATMGNQSNGVRVDSSGATFTANVVGHNAIDGFQLNSAATLIGNFIGVAPDGTALGNDSFGIEVKADGSTITSNLIEWSGFDPSAFVDDADGISINASHTTISGNTIANNTQNGVAVYSGVDNSIQHNSIHDNSGLGIDLVNPNDIHPATVTPNDSAGHVGPNDFQNFPVITSAVINGTNLKINGHLDNATVGAVYTIDVYANTTPDASMHGEGEIWLGQITFTADASGAFQGLVARPASASAALSSTATDSDGNTSEFSLDAAAIVGAPTLVTVTANSNPNPSFYGQTVTLIANVSSLPAGSPAPTGMVTFKDGSTVVGTATLDSTGAASITVSSLSVGNHPITAVYGGDVNSAPGTSNVVSQNVDQDITMTDVSADYEPSVLGQSVTFTATVSVDSSLANSTTGTIAFYIDSVLVATKPLSGHMASYTASGLSVGEHDVSAVYSGDANNTNSEALSTHTVNAAATSTSLTSSQSPSQFNQLVNFTATVISGATRVTAGTVQFLEGTTVLGAASLDADGQATFGTSTLSVGTHNIVARYLATTNFAASDSAPLAQVVTKDATMTSLASSPNPSIAGQSVTFTATVNVTGASGTITFSVDGTSIAPVSIDALGQATFTTSSLSVGGHTIVATYSGDANDFGSSSATLNQTVSAAATSTSVASSVNPSTVGQSVTFTATVRVNAPGSGTATGTVTFKDGASVLGTGTLNASGVATFSTSSLSVGGHSITAVYNGDANDNGSTTAPLTQNVNPNATSTTVSSSVNPSVLNQAVTFTATVSGVGTPTGTVTFMDGTTTLATGTLNASGVATFTTSALMLGTHPITAVYGGDTNDSASTSAALNQVVNKDATSTSISSSANPSVTGQSVTFTANVAVLAPGAGLATGTVTFMDGTTSLGTGTLTGGVATFSTSSLSVGGHNITAVYGGDTNDNGSTSAILTQVVNVDVTSTSLTSSLNPSVFGQTITFTASVSVNAPGAGTVTGTVQFKDGSMVIGTGTLNASGVASFTTSALSIGSHNITAVYSGDSNNAASTSAPVVQAVNSDATTTTISSSVNPSFFGQSVTFTATVAVNAPGAGNATGTVTFKDGATTLGTAALSGGVATFSTAALSVGGHSITAVYNGDTNDNGSTSAVLTQNVSAANTSTTVTSSLNPAATGQLVTFTANVAVLAPGAGAPTGSIVFKDGSTTLATVGINASGVATFSTSSLSGGTHSITATYSGDSSFNTSGGGLSQIVNAAANAAISGVVFCDENLNGNLNGGDEKLSGAKIALTDTSGHVVATATSAADGSYSFFGVVPGSYTLSVTTPAAGHVAGPVHGGPIPVSVTSGATSANNNFAEVEPGNFSGFVYADENNDGNIDMHEAGIVNVTVKLSGTDCFGNIVGISTVTDDDGQYIFANVNPGTYKITEVQPSCAEFTEGKVTVGSLGGTVCGQDAISNISLGGCGDNAINYNFGELGKTITHGATATIGFWHNKNGQALLNSLNGGPNSTALGNWLAGNFTHIYSMFAGKSNSYIANFYNANDFAASGVKLDAQVLAAAFACYVTNSSWAGGAYAAGYGFTVSAQGSGYETINVGSNGAAFGVANNSNITVLQALAATDAMSSGTTLYNGNTTLRNAANTVYSAINQGGDIT